MKIAIIDASRRQTEAVSKILVAAGHACDAYARASAFFEQWPEQGWDLLLLDAQATDISVLQTLARVRAHVEIRLPVLLLAQADDVEAIVTILAAGADDYLAKPVRQAELLARVRVLLLRAWPEQAASAQLRQGAYWLDPQAGRVTMNGKPVELTQKEFALALLFFRHVGQPLSRATILEAVWGGDREASFRSIDTHVSRVRSKLGLRPVNGLRLLPVYGYGYLLEPVSG